MSFSKKVSISFILFALLAVSISAVLIPNAEASKNSAPVKRKQVKINKRFTQDMDLEQVRKEKSKLEKYSGNANNQMDVLSRIAALNKREQYLLEVVSTEGYKQLQIRLDPNHSSQQQVTFTERQKNHTLVDQNQTPKKGSVTALAIDRNGEYWLQQEKLLPDKTIATRKRVGVGIMIGSAVLMAVPAHIAWKCDWWNERFKNWGWAPQDDRGCSWTQHKNVPIAALPVD